LDAANADGLWLLKQPGRAMPGMSAHGVVVPSAYPHPHWERENLTCFSSRASANSRAGADGTVLVPLKTLQVFDTRDPDELAAGFSRLFGRVWLDLHGKNAKFHARVSYFALGDVGITHGQD